MNIKYFADRINKELNSAGFPPNAQERARAFSKAFKVPVHMAGAILAGSMPLTAELTERLAEEFEIPLDELVGTKKA